jgi:hypothetical protein
VYGWSFFGVRSKPKPKPKEHEFAQQLAANQQISNAPAPEVASNLESHKVSPTVIIIISLDRSILNNQRR